MTQPSPCRVVRVRLMRDTIAPPSTERAFLRPVKRVLCKATQPRRADVPSKKPNFSEAYKAFVTSMNIGMDEWRGGVGLDINSLHKGLASGCAGPAKNLTE